MVSIATNQCLQIFFNPGTEEFIVVKRFLWSYPRVKCLIHNKESKLITEIKELRCRRVMTCPDRIASHFLKQFELTLCSSDIECRTKGAEIVMVANSIYIYSFPVEIKTFSCSKIERSESEVCFNHICCFISFVNIDNYFVKFRILKIP